MPSPGLQALTSRHTNPLSTCPTQAEDPAEAISALNKTLHSPAGTAPGGGGGGGGGDGSGGDGGARGETLKVSALLYAKVVNVLLRSNQSEHAHALLPLIRAKTADIVSAFPAPREVAALVLALRRLDDPLLR